MPYWDTLGRSFIAEDTKESANRIAEYLTYSGLDATVSSHPDHELFIVTVPASQEATAEKLMNIMRENEQDLQDPDAYYRENFLQRSPIFVPSEEKFRYTTNSSLSFICAGLVILVMALLHFFLVIFHRQNDSLQGCITEMILGCIFMMFGLTTHQKVQMLEKQVQEENSFTNQIVDWCTTIYPAEHLDKCIDAASSSQELSEEERFFLRRELIQNYILREYDISDEAYMNYLVDLIYKRIYHPNAVSAC